MGVRLTLMERGEAEKVVIKALRSYLSRAWGNMTTVTPKRLARCESLPTSPIELSVIADALRGVRTIKDYRGRKWIRIKRKNNKKGCSVFVYMRANALREVVEEALREILRDLDGASTAVVSVEDIAAVLIVAVDRKVIEDVLCGINEVRVDGRVWVRTTVFQPWVWRCC